MFENVFAVCLVMGLLFATVWLLRKKGFATPNFKFGRDSRGKKMQVLERLSLTPHHSLHLVRVDDATILIGVSPSSCSDIRAWSGSAKEVSNAVGQEGFREIA